MIGEILDAKYRIDKQLGAGGMGNVYLATHLGTTRVVALEAGEKLRLRRPFRSDHFERDDASGSEVRGQIDVPHSARAELLVDAVFAVEDFAGHGVSERVQAP